MHISLFSVLNPCGVITHETYNQLYPETARALAAQLSDKDLLGYHDIRVGNTPDQRLSHFINVNLPRLLPASRKRFDHFKDLIADYANQRIDYVHFLEQVKARTEGGSKPSVKARSGQRSKKARSGLDSKRLNALEALKVSLTSSKKSRSKLSTKKSRSKPK